MSKTRTWKIKDFNKMLKKNGYHLAYQQGSHKFYVNDNGDKIPVPTHNGEINKMLALRIKKEYNLTW